LAPGGGLIVEKGYESLDMAKRVTHCSRMLSDLLLCHLDCGNHLSQQRTINNLFLERNYHFPKYKGTSYESLTREEFELTKTVVSDNALCPLMTRYTLSS
jgi:hypothetical protein